MTQQELIEKAATWLYLNLSSPALKMSEEEKQWWVNDFVDYMNSDYEE